MRLTTAQEELQWQEFKSHLEWAELFSLIILFVEDGSLVEIFRTRLYHQQQGNVSTLKILQPTNAEQLSENFFAKLQTQIIPDVKVPLWLELYQPSAEWNNARDHFFSRLNEYRDQLRYKFPYPVIILVPLDYKARLRDIAPDLWSVRSYTDEFLTTDLNTATEQAGIQEVLNLNPHFQGKASKAAEVLEWQRINKQQVSDDERLQVGFRAFYVAFKLGDRQVAEEIVKHCLSLINDYLLNEPESAEYLRYLSIFLNIKGELENALGRREAAYEQYQESLKISRRLRETLGETPETLRDLSISLEKMGDIESERGEKQRARHYFSECLVLWQRLKAASTTDKETDRQIQRIKKKCTHLE